VARVGAQDSGCVRIQQHATAYFTPSRVTAQPKRCCQTTVADPAKVTLKRRGVWGLANAVHIMQRVPDGSAPLADSGQLLLFWRALFPPSAGRPRLRLGGGRVRVRRWPLYVPCIDAAEKGDVTIPTTMVGTPPTKSDPTSRVLGLPSLRSVHQ
jgi:hypothetical protein